MRNYLILFITILLNIAAMGQKKKEEKSAYYLFNINWQPVSDPDNAVYLGKRIHSDDTTWQWWYYKYTGPLVAIETYKDEAETTPHGFWAWYDREGRLDSMGYTYEGKKDRTWLYYTDSFTVYTTETYKHGILLEREDQEMLAQKRKDRDTLKLQPGEKEATFKGGEGDWKSYMSKMTAPDRTEQLKAKGTVRVLFVVQVDGSIDDIRLISSVEYAIDDEAMRYIRTCPRWNPATQGGKNVKAYRIQPVTVDF